MGRSSANANPAVAILLTLSGGFLDALTFVGHDRIFANSMTGNIVLTAVNFAAGENREALRHLVPLTGFVAGVLGAHLLRLALPRSESMRAIISLIFESAFLFAGAMTHVSQRWLIPGISFFAALQTTVFTHWGTQPYSSVMTTGNLLRALQGFFQSTMPRLDRRGIRDAALLAATCLCFACGALAGALETHRLHDRALVIPSMLVFSALVCLVTLIVSKRVRRT
jgi:uncharacterized membrane protein YoaK (UPF0700 family)